jgi:ribosomal protein S18 acetylase RimI-like enzyme
MVTSATFRAAGGLPALPIVAMTRIDVAIVRARPEQLPEVQRLAGVIWRAHYLKIISAAQIEYMLARGYALDALAQFLGAPDRGLELATVDGALAGFAAWYVTTDPGTAKLDKLYVLQSRQRLGLGGRLIARVEELARAAGATTLILNVNKYNAQAIRAYEKHGFAIREAVVVDIGQGHVMDDYVMARSLVAADGAH